MSTPTTDPIDDRRRRKGVVLALVGGAAAFGLVGASAATLNGITGASLGADASVVASCDGDGVDVDYTTSYDAGAGTYVATEVLVTSVDAACDGLGIDVTLADAGGAVLGNGAGTVAGGAATVALGTPADAETVANIAIVISG